MARSYDSVKNFIEVESKSGCKLISTEYIRDKDYLEFECECGTPFRATFDRFRSGNKRKCKECTWEIKKKHYKWSDYTKDDFINLVKNKAIELNKTPKQEDFGNKNNLPSASTIIPKLGLNTWNEVLQLCGVGKAKEKNYNAEKVLNKLKHCIDSLGYVPTMRELETLKFQPSMSWFSKKYDSFETVLQMIGYSSITTDEELLNILKDFHIKNNKSPTTKDMTNKNRLPSTETYYRRFNTHSWNKILQLAGLELNHFIGYTKEYALKKLKEYFNTYNKILTKEEFEKYNLAPAHDWYCGHFGSYENACYLAGLTKKPLTDEERIEISINELIKLANSIRRCPTVSEYEIIEHRGFSRRVLEDKLNIKYNDICRKYLSEYELNNDLDIPKEKILSDIKEVCEKLGKPPIFSKLKDFGLHYSYSIFESKFNMSYNQLISSMGYEPSGTTTFSKNEETLLDEFYNYFKVLGRIPYTNELNSSSMTASQATYHKFFGTIKNVCDILNIDYETYYKDVGACRTYIDKNGDICRSLVELHITNFLIDNNVKYEKETFYSELIDFMGRKRFDWKIYINDKIYYVEYFGLFSKNPKRNIDKKYVIRTKYKIKKLYQYGFKDQCLFIFPNDIKTKSLEEIFSKIGVQVINKVA